MKHWKRQKKKKSQISYLHMVCMLCESLESLIIKACVFFSGFLIRCWRSTCWDIQNSILSSLLDIQPQNLLTVHRSNPLLDADLLILVNWLFLHHQSARHLSDSKPLNFFCATVFGWRDANFTDRESSSEFSLKATW